LWHWLTHSEAELSSKGRGATFKQVNRQDICELMIPLPSLAEQRRIAAILDQADALRAKRREALAHLDDRADVPRFRLGVERVDRRLDDVDDLV